jgi:hypothetical protein
MPKLRVALTNASVGFWVCEGFAGNYSLGEQLEHGEQEKTSIGK